MQLRMGGRIFVVSGREGAMAATEAETNPECCAKAAAAAAVPKTTKSAVCLCLPETRLARTGRKGGLLTADESIE